MRLSALVLAAGSSSRMGADKLALAWRGGTILAAAIEPLLGHPEVGEVLVVVRPGAPPPGLPEGVRLVPNRGHAEGMASSIVAGVGASDPGSDGWLVALGDMPGLSWALVERLLRAFSREPRPVLVPVHGGRRGHPVLFARSCEPHLLALRGEAGARGVLAGCPESVTEFLVDDPSVLFDVDVPADLAAAAIPLRRRGRVLVRGAGEQASGTAHRLFRAGFRVAMTELAEPGCVRRAVAFSEAILLGRTEVEGVRAVAWPLDHATRLDAFDWTHVPVFVDPGRGLLRAWCPDVLVDARLLKHPADTRMVDASLVIGLGPGLVAGRDVHLVVETQRGHDLGRLIDGGPAAPDSGVPGRIGGFGAERVLRAPAAGVFSTHVGIGDRVRAGDVVGDIDGVAVFSAIAGAVRGLLRSGQGVEAGQKLGDVDPRGDPRSCRTLSDKTRAISGAVLEAVTAFYGRRG